MYTIHLSYFDSSNFVFPVAIAELADRNANILVPDEGAQYDQLVEINLDEVRVHFLPIFVYTTYVYVNLEQS